MDYVMASPKAASMAKIAEGPLTLASFPLSLEGMRRKKIMLQTFLSNLDKDG